MKKEIIIIVLCLVVLGLIIKARNKFTYIENKDLNICQKCAIIDGNYYCQTFGMESDK